MSKLFDKFRSYETPLLLMLALLVGTGSGLGAVLFVKGFSFVQALALGSSDEYFLISLLDQPAWRIVLAPTVGGLLVGLVVHYLLPRGRPVGVPQVIEASALKGADLPARTGFAAAFASVLSIGTGASVGREGPMVHFAGSIGAWVGKRFGVNRESRRVLMACGVSAGIAASFSAPLAGTIFALEVVLGHYAVRAFAPVVASAVIGTLISQHFLDGFGVFQLSELVILSPFEFPAFALLGVLCGLVAVAMTRTLLAAGAFRNRLPGPGWIHPAFAGCLVGLIALAFPQVLGVGYETISRTLNGEVLIWFGIALVAAKLIATAISVGGGFVGGIISPGLFIGAMMGGVFGSIATALSPVEASVAQVYVLVGMGAMAAAVIGAPISTILFIFEITQSYPVTLGVMLAVVIATVTYRGLGLRSFFIEVLRRGGVSLEGGHDVGHVRNQTIWDQVDRTVFPISPDTSFDDVRERLLRAPWGQVFVVDGETFVGSITLRSWQEHAQEEACTDLTARDLVTGDEAVPATASLRLAMRLFRDSDEAHLPVIYSAEEPRLVGIVHEHDVNLAYHRAVLKSRGLEGEPDP